VTEIDHPPGAPGHKVTGRWLFQNERTMTKMMMLCGQWMRNKEDLLMRDLFASSPAYLNATGGLNGKRVAVLKSDLIELELLAA
jgi:hypothetical protein